MFNILIILYFAPVVLASNPQNRLADVVLTDLHIKNYAEDIMPIFDLKLLPWRGGHNVINGTFVYAQDMHKMQMKFTLSFEKPDKTRINMMDFLADVCELLKGVYNKQTIPKIVLSMLNKQARFPQRCPMEGNKTYGLDNFYLETPQFPLPNLKFFVVISLFTADKQRKIFDLYLKGVTKRL